MARSIYNIDFNSLIWYGNILCKYGYAPFPFKVIVVKDEFSQLLLFPCLTRLINHPVHQRGLAMVDMRDDCNIPYFLHNLILPNLFSFSQKALQKYTILPSL